MRPRFATLLLLATLIAPAGAAPPARAPRLPPLGGAAKKEIEDLFARYLAANDADRPAILAEVRRRDPIPEAAAKEFRKDLLAAARKGLRVDGESRSTLAHPDYPGSFLLSGASGGRPKGLLVGLHGGGEGSGDPSEAAQKWQSATGMDCICVFPEAIDKVQTAWNKEKQERFVLALIEAVKRTWPVDTNRVFLVGHSMGGYGTWSVGGHNADLFAAISPNAGGIYVQAGEDRKIVGHVPGVVANLCNTPVYFTHGDNDVQCWVEPDRLAARLLGDLRKEHPGFFDFTYKEYAGIGHALPPDGTHPILEWLTSHRRNPWPKKVVWEPAVAWKNTMFWVRKEKPEGGRIVAEVREGNLIAVAAADGPTDLSLLLSDDLVDLDKPLVVTLNGAEVFRGFAQPSAAALLESIAERNDPAMVATARIDLGGAK